jgi:hypothetical protein
MLVPHSFVERESHGLLKGFVFFFFFKKAWYNLLLWIHFALKNMINKIMVLSITYFYLFIFLKKYDEKK